MKTKIIFTAIILLGVIFGIWFFYPSVSERKNEPVTEKAGNHVSYVCKNSKTIEAVYFVGTPVATVPSEPPVPTGRVDIVLSDGRTLSLPQTISASGIRYANGDESIIFWSKGNGAFLMENNKETYMDCMLVAPDSGNLPEVYVNSANGFSVRYPAGYSVNPDYQYKALGPGKEIQGVKFTIPAEMSTGTNLSGYDTGVSIEVIPNVRECTADLFVFQNVKSVLLTDREIEYSVATTTDAGAGNYYEESVWAFPGTNPCVAVRYLIHSMNFGNYPPGTVREFNRNAILEQFDAIRRALIMR